MPKRLKGEPLLPPHEGYGVADHPDDGGTTLTPKLAVFVVREPRGNGSQAAYDPDDAGGPNCVTSK